jgi:hypothetical protein
MPRGAERFEFIFELGGVVHLDCVATVRFGEVQKVVPYYKKKLFDTDGIVIDWQDEFLSLSETLLHYARKFYKESKDNIEIEVDLC